MVDAMSESGNSSRPRRLFSVEQANAVLPLVRAITSDLAQLANELQERRQRLAALQSRRDGKSRDVYGEEVAQTEEELERDVERIDEYVAELLELGVEPKGAAEGLVDFPSLIDGRLVYLCWKLGEPEVLHWHEIDAGFRGRQPLTAIVGPADDDRADTHGIDSV